MPRKIDSRGERHDKRMHLEEIGQPTVDSLHDAGSARSTVRQARHAGRVLQHCRDDGAELKHCTHRQPLVIMMTVTTQRHNGFRHEVDQHYLDVRAAQIAWIADLHHDCQHQA